MENKQVAPDFEALEYLLIVASTPFSPSYIHGMMLGVLCIGKHSLVSSWKSLQQSVGCLRDPDSTISKSFEKLFMDTACELKGLESNLLLVLPTDEEPLSQRLEALSDWCEGFMDGIKLDNFDATLLNNPTVKEILMDFVQIQEISSSALESEHNEKNYMELIEFVRVGALLLHAECVETAMQTSEHYSKEVH